MAWFYFIFVSLVWSANFIMMKKAALCYGPLTIAGWRLLGGAATLGVIWVWRRAPWPFRKEHFSPLLMIVSVIYLWPFALLPYLIHNYGSAFMGMMIGLVPLTTLLAGIPMMRQWPTTRQVIGVIGGLGFLALLLGEGLKRNIATGDLAMALSVPCCYAVGNTYIRMKFEQMPPLQLSCSALLLAGVPMMLMAQLLPTETTIHNSHLPVATANLAAVGILATGVTMYLFYRIIQQQGPLFAGMTAYVIPAGALLWGWLDGELITLRQVVGLLGILAMVAITQLPARKAHIHPCEQLE